MKKPALSILIIVSLLFVSCSKQPAPKAGGGRPHDLCRVKITPVKQQGESDFCWIYAMLATIESEHLMQGDSVNLSAAFLARKHIESLARRAFLLQTQSDGRNDDVEAVTTRGIAGRTLALLRDSGIVPYDAYHPVINYRTLTRKVELLVEASRRSGMEAFDNRLDHLMDDNMRPAPRYAFMLGAEYTVGEFARSVCRADEYMAITSFTHHPFGRRVVLELPDNTDHQSFLNLPPDTLMAWLDRALMGGHPVCWEGDISEPRFSWSRGIAKLAAADEESVLTGTALAEARQKDFELGNTTDDHCMELIGIAQTDGGRRYYVAKNSWGTGNAFHGLMYLSENYVRLKTIALWMSRAAVAGA